MAIVYLDGIAMPDKVTDITEVDNKVWSSNTGRTSTGRMDGTIKAVKKTVHVTWGGLTAAEAQKIRDKASSKKEWHTIKYSKTTGGTGEFECYFDNVQFTSKRLGRVLTGVSLTCIER